MFHSQPNTPPKERISIGVGRLAKKIYDNSEVVEKVRVNVVLDITDKFRAAQKSNPPFNNVTEDLADLLNLLIESESNSRRLAFSTIETSRLDKLLNELIDLKEHDVARIANLLRCASILKRKWQIRFGEKYFAIDEIRLAQLSIKGALCRVALSSLSSDLQKWHVTQPSPGSENPGPLHFLPGRWWLCLACAYRDGIVGTASPGITTGAYGVTAFPLVNGLEVEGEKPGEVIFLRQGALGDIGVPLLTEIGRSIRILRGYQLRSKYAPAAGLRYDGLYTLTSWGHRLGPEANVYNSKMVFQRHQAQKSMEEILPIPMPSQLDDWKLYQTIKDRRQRLASRQ